MKRARAHISWQKPTGSARAFLRSFAKDQKGAALVEFGLMLPILILLFAMVVEGGRLMWSYQTVVAGVRDATRYVARVAPQNICSSGGNLAGFTTDVERIVRESVSGDSLFPTGITVTGVTPGLTCVVGTYRVSPAGIVEVTADLQVTFPFAGGFTFAGQTLATITTSIADQSRIYGS
ncbi:TadE/TadG family type IV pilus assembly protein [Shimia biformata]|uniref:TadE/TadG family type IV pilus assembly protein n=1 Tax=Shimia biformata TaxID=1294299 RepID=UPI00194FFB1E|nr:TadE/TadG family type IV pilus assembly protein [Shimia biformata]